MKRHKQVHDAITSAATFEQALDASNAAVEIYADALDIRKNYIRDVFGDRATGGFFKGTRSNINAKFKQAWEAARNR